MLSYVIAKMKLSFFPDDIIDVDSAHERHFRTTSMTSIRRKRVKNVKETLVTLVEKYYICKLTSED